MIAELHQDWELWDHKTLLSSQTVSWEAEASQESYSVSRRQLKWIQRTGKEKQVTSEDMYNKKKRCPAGALITLGSISDMIHSTRRWRLRPLWLTKYSIYFTANLAKLLSPTMGLGCNMSSVDTEDLVNLRRNIRTLVWILFKEKLCYSINQDSLLTTVPKSSHF